MRKPRRLQVVRETGATGLEPAPSGVTGRRSVPAGELGDEKPTGVSGLRVAPRFHGRDRFIGSVFLSVQIRTFSPTFSRTRLIQPDPTSSSLGDLAQPCGCWTSLGVSGRVAMQKVVGSNPIIRFQKAPLGGFFVASAGTGTSSSTRFVPIRAHSKARS
jgi:hypothetical protein